MYHWLCRTRSLWVVGVAAMAVACSSAQGPATPPANGGSPKITGKGDCPDCDPGGGSAFQQTGMASRFYRPGDTFYVAFRFDHRSDMAMSAPTLLTERKTASEVYLFRYRVLSVTKNVFDRVMREVAEIEVTQATPPSHAELFAPDRLDQHEPKLLFTLNDLLDPIEETLFNSEYPDGYDVEVNQKSSLNTGSSVYPHTIPRILVSGSGSGLPPVPPDLADILAVFAPTWDQRTFQKYEFDNGDVVFWARGDLWPFYVRTSQGEGVLIQSDLAN